MQVANAQATVNAAVVMIASTEQGTGYTRLLFCKSNANDGQAGFVFFVATIDSGFE